MRVILVSLGLTIIFGGIAVGAYLAETRSRLNLNDCTLMAKDRAFSSGYFDIYYCENGVFMKGPNEKKEREA